VSTKDKDAAISAAIKGDAETLEPLLPCRIPSLLIHSYNSTHLERVLLGRYAVEALELDLELLVHEALSY
jgi:hypothetical protein